MFGPVQSGGSRPIPQSSVRARSRIVVLDDNDENLRVIERMLRRDHEVHAVTSIADALAVLSTNTIDLVLCDQMLRGEYGTWLAREVRARWPAVTFLILTGWEDAPELRDAVARGDVDQVIGKPVWPQMLRTRVKAALERP